MVEFEINVTQEYWDEALFDCQATRTGSQKMEEIARRFQGESMRPDEEYLTIDDAEEEYNLDIIGTGKTRVVINLPENWVTGTGDCIAKIQWDPTYHQTAGEIQTWNNASGSTAALLAPVLDHSEYKQWLIMPRAERYTDLSVKETGRISDKLRDGLRDQGYRAQDIRRANVGRVMGRDVVIDYGVLRER